MGCVQNRYLGRARYASGLIVGGRSVEYRRQELILSVLLAAILVVPACVAAAPQGRKAAQEKEWTLMMYWDADNNLEF